MTLLTYQKSFDFTHNDLHTNNIMFQKTDKKKVDDFIRIIFQYITSRTPLSGKFVIAKG